MAADCTGIENLKEKLATYKNVYAIHVFSNTGANKKVPKAICSHENGDIFEQLERFFENNENAQKEHKLLVKAKPSEKLVDLINITFQYMEKQTYAVNGQAPSQPSGHNPQEFAKSMELYMEVGFLRAENKRLQAENAQLQSKINDLEVEVAEMAGELEEAEMNGVEENPIEKFKEYLPYIGMLFNKPTQAPNVVNGVEDVELNGIIAELQTIDKNFKENMFRLLKLAKNKPEVYKMAVGYLNNL